jgi:hypothetical protein
MNPLYFTLNGDGPSDAMLIPVVRWVLRDRLGPDVAINDRFVYHSSPLVRRVEVAIRESGGCDLIVIHRDAERADGHTARVAEITEAVRKLSDSIAEFPPHVCVVPVRMSEAWLLFNESAIRRAAAKPNGRADLNLPRRDYDRLSDPKTLLGTALDRASELSGRKLANFQRDRRPEWVARRIEDFSPLRQLAAFRVFEAEINEFATAWLASQIESDDN